MYCDRQVIHKVCNDPECYAKYRLGRDERNMKQRMSRHKRLNDVKYI